MPAPHDIHPDREQLVAFGLGKLDPERTSQIEQHLEACQECCSTILNLQDDTFVGLVRACQPAHPAADDTGVTLEAAAGSRGTDRTDLELPPALANHERYEIQQLIGRGGMGDVYRAQHKLMNRQVALKIVKPHLVRNEAAAGRFRREVQAAARLHHRNIVTAHDADKAGDIHFLVMEFVQGVNLDEVIRERGPLPVAEACNYIRQAAAGLQHAHELGMVHRDIKPHNLMVTKAGEVKILDFGLAGFATETAEEDVRNGGNPRPIETAATLHQLTQMGTMMGTPDYIAPEQAADAHAADIRADIYSLGCTFYALLTGRAPFAEGSVLEKLKAHGEREARALADFRDDVPAEIEAVLRKMMAKDPAERYQTPQDVVDALAAYVDARVEAKLREMGIDRLPPKPPQRLSEGAHGWYERLAGFMWSVAMVDLLGAGLLAVLIAFLAYSGAEGLLEFVQRPLALMVLGGAIPGAILLCLVPSVRRGADFGWIVVAACLCLFPACGWPLGIFVGSLALWCLLLPQFRDPSHPTLSAAQRLSLVAAFVFPIALTAACVAVYVQSANGPYRGELIVSATDRDANISLFDNKGHLIEGTRSSENDRLRAFRVLPGTYWLKAYRDGDENQVLLWRRVDVGATGVLTVEFPGRLRREAPPPAPLSVSVIELSADRLTVEVCNRSKEVITAAEGDTPIYSSQFERGRWPFQFDWQTNGLKPGECRRRTYPRYAEIPPFLESLAIDVVSVNFENGKQWTAKDSQPLVTAGESAADKVMEIGRLEGHERNLDCLAYSPDGKYLYSGGGERLLYQWDVADRKVIRKVPVGDFVVDVAPLPDNQHVVTAQYDGGITLWDMHSGRAVRQFNGHRNFVLDLAIDPQGKRLLSGGSDGLVRLWNLETAETIREFQAAYCSAVAVSPDGVHAAHDSTNGLVVWNMATGEEVALLNRKDAICALAFSPDGRYLASGDFFGQVSVWQWRDQSQVYLFDDHEAVVHSLEFTDDGRHIITGSEDRTLGIYNLQVGRQVHHATCDKQQSQYLSLAPDGRTLASGGGLRRIPKDDKQVEHVMDDEFPILLWQLPADVWPQDAGGRIASSGEAALLIGMNDDFGLLLEGRLVAPAELSRLLQEAIKQNPDREVVIDLPKRPWTVAGHVDQLEQIARIAGAKRITRPAWAPAASAGTDDTAARTLQEDVRLEGLRDFVAGLAFAPNGSHLVTAGAEGATIWNARNGRRVRELPGHTGSVHAVAVSSDGQHVAAAGKGNAIILASFATGEEIRRFSGHTGFVECVAFSPDGSRLASGSSNWVRKEKGDVTVRVWDAESGDELWKADIPRTPENVGMVYDVLFTPDGSQLVTVHHGPKDGISVFDAATGDLLRRFSGSHSSIKCAALSPDGEILATGHEAIRVRERVWNDPENAVIRLWELKTGREVGKLVGHTGGIQSLDFSHDGQRLVSCSGGQFLNNAYNPHPSQDNTLRVWDVASRRELIRQPLEKHGQRAVFSPDSRYIASSAGEVGEAPLVQIWRVPISSAYESPSLVQPGQ